MCFFHTNLEVILTMKPKGDVVDLHCEPCTICKKSIPLKMNKNDYKSSISGVSQVVDIHGLDHPDKKHVRIL